MPCPLVSDSLLTERWGKVSVFLSLKSEFWGCLGKMVEVMLSDPGCKKWQLTPPITQVAHAWNSTTTL